MQLLPLPLSIAKSRELKLLASDQVRVLISELSENSFAEEAKESEPLVDFDWSCATVTARFGDLRRDSVKVSFKLPHLGDCGFLILERFLSQTELIGLMID